MKLEETIRNYREMKGLSQAEVASQLGIKTPAYTMYETNSRTPKLEVRYQIARALDIDPLLLIGSDLTPADWRRILLRAIVNAGPLKIGNNNEITIELNPNDYGAFIEMYQSCFNPELTSENAAIAHAEFQYYLETFPKFDYIIRARELGADAEQGGNYSIKSICLRELSNAVAVHRKKENDIYNLIEYGMRFQKNGNCKIP